MLFTLNAWVLSSSSKGQPWGPGIAMTGTPHKNRKGKISLCVEPGVSFTSAAPAWQSRGPEFNSWYSHIEKKKGEAILEWGKLMDPDSRCSKREIVTQPPSLSQTLSSSVSPSSLSLSLLKWTHRDFLYSFVCECMCICPCVLFTHMP